MSQAPVRSATFIAGHWVEPERTVPVVNPADRSVLCQVGYGGARDAILAADAAADAFAGWAATPARGRADILAAAGRLLESRAEGLGVVLSQETGKRRVEGVGEIRFAAEYFRWFAEEVRRPQGHSLTNELPGRRHVTLRRPAGVVASLTPWNFPVSIQARKLAPALAAGCTVVARASEKAPLAVAGLIACLEEAGLPAGVVNLIQGPAAEQSEALLDHPAVRVVSFTGSTEVGRSIMAGASRRVVRVALELGGDAPFIVFDDADVDLAVQGALLAKFRNNGESCIAANRFFIQDGVYQEFRDRLVAAVDGLSIGDPAGEPEPDLGPLIDDQQVARVQAMVDAARSAGARRLTAQRPVPRSGSYLCPVLFEDVPEGTDLACREVFGPVAGLFRFGRDAEAIEAANRTEMGLAAYFYTRDLKRAWTVTEALEAGIVGCNTPLPSSVIGPMGGVKQSGLGREGSSAGLEEFTETRFATWEL